MQQQWLFGEECDSGPVPASRLRTLSLWQTLMLRHEGSGLLCCENKVFEGSRPNVHTFSKSVAQPWSKKLHLFPPWKILERLDEHEIPG